MTPKRNESLRTIIERLAAHHSATPVRLNPLRWIRWTDFDRDIETLWQLLPAEISGVIGCPRSGMYAAAKLAIMAGRPLYKADKAGPPQHLGHGLRLEQAPVSYFQGPLLLVEDSTNTANSIRAYLKHCPPGTLTAVVYANPDNPWQPDFRALPLPLPHFFEWHFFGSRDIERTSIDMDGVLCEDCPPTLDDDGPGYADWLQHVRPRLLPRTYPVGAIVTARLEKYREQTVSWLAQHAVRYDRLIMGPWRKQSDRRDIPSWKAQVYAGQPGHHVFIESCAAQAARIHEKTGRPVICNNTGEIWI